MTLEQELIDLFAAGASPRNRDILIGYYGWADGRPHTLTEIGHRYGITRERVRQICAKLTRRTKKPVGPAPVLTRTLKLIHDALPAPAAQIEAELTRRGLTAIGMGLEAVAVAARLLGKPVEYQLVAVPVEVSSTPSIPAHSKTKQGGIIRDDRLAVRHGQEQVVAVTLDVAKKDAYFHGLTTIERIERTISTRGGRSNNELIRQTLAMIDGFRWLDEPAGWFSLESVQRHGLPRTIDKALAVAGELTVGRLHCALSRNRRLWKKPPPESVLLEYCRGMPGVRVVGDRIIADPPRDWRKSLTGVEAKLVAVLKQHGPLMERGQMEDICVGDGMNRFSFHAFVSWSPVIAQYGHSVYGLLGAEVSPEQLDAALSRRRSGEANRRVLAGHGTLPDGKIWLQYRLSKAASTYAVITIPAALKKQVRGRFKLLDSHGVRIGTLATKDGRAWGLGAFLRKNTARIGDRIMLVLDLEKRTAEVAWKEKPSRKPRQG